MPVLTPEVWALARRLADRSAGTASDILRLAVPRPQVRVEKAWLARAPQPPQRHRGRPSPIGAEWRVAGARRGRAGRARLRAPACCETRWSRERADRAARRSRGSPQLPDGTWVGEWAVTLAALAADCWRGGRSAILAVPDYRDQEQLAAALAAIAPAEAVVRADAAPVEPRPLPRLPRGALGPAHRDRQPLRRLRAGRASSA